MTSRSLTALVSHALALVALPIQAEVISIAPRDSAGLVAAIEYANRTPGPDTIELAAGSLYAFDRPIDAKRSLALPTIRTSIRVLGNGAEIRAYSTKPLLLIDVARAGSLRIEHLTLAEGSAGAVVNRGDLELWHVAIVDNSATGAGASSIVTNYGNLFARHTEFAWNELVGTQRDAGILLNYGRLDLAHAMIKGNRVLRRHAGPVSASAILSFGATSLREVHVVDNAADEAEPHTRSAALVAIGNGSFDEIATRIEGNAPDVEGALYVAD